MAETGRKTRAKPGRYRTGSGSALEPLLPRGERHPSSVCARPPGPRKWARQDSNSRTSWDPDSPRSSSSSSITLRWTPTDKAGSPWRTKAAKSSRASWTSPDKFSPTNVRPVRRFGATSRSHEQQAVQENVTRHWIPGVALEQMATCEGRNLPTPHPNIRPTIAAGQWSIGLLRRAFKMTGAVASRGSRRRSGLPGALVTHSQAAEVVLVREAAFDHPALAPEARTEGGTEGRPRGEVVALVLLDLNPCPPHAPRNEALQERNGVSGPLELLAFGPRG